MEKDLSTFLVQGALRPEEAAAVREGVNRLCGLLTDGGARLALQMVDGFNLPEHLLGAPIAVDWHAM